MQVRLTREEIEKIAVAHINDVLRSSGYKTQYLQTNLFTYTDGTFGIKADISRIAPAAPPKPRTAKKKKK